jgi:hypothetical protein
MGMFGPDENQDDMQFAIGGPAMGGPNPLAPPPEALPMPPKPPGIDAQMADLAQKQAGADKLKAYLGVAGSVGQNFADIPSAHEMLYGGKAHHTNVKGAMDAAAAAMPDPTARQAKLYESYMNAKKMQDSQKEDAYSAQLDKTDSKETMALKSLAPRWGIQVTPEMTGADIQKLIDPKKMMQTEAESRVNFGNQKALHEMDNKASLQKFQAEQGMRNQEKREIAAKPSEKQVESMTDLDNASNDLKNITGMLGENSEWTGSLDGRVPDMLVGADQVAFRSALGKYKDAYRKAVTGAGASVAEIARLESRLPSETDTHANFKAKANEALRELEQRKKTLTSNYSKMGKNVAAFGGDDMSKTAQSYEPDVLKYAKEHNITPDQAANIKASRTSNVGQR